MASILIITCASISGITLGMVLQHKIDLAAPRVHNLSSIGASSHPSATPTRLHLTESLPSPTQQLIAPDDSKLMAKLTELTQQQKSMQSQQAELNRDINEIQFRLDSHSQDFRPLRTERSIDSLSLPSSEMDLNPLLPPRM